jgi:hypothetical protein
VVAGEDVGALGHEVHAAEHDVLRVGARRRLLGELERVAGDVGELDHLVALVVVAEDEDVAAEGVLRGAGARDQVGVGGGGEFAGAVDAALGAGVGSASEQQERGLGGSRFIEARHGGNVNPPRTLSGTEKSAMRTPRREV